MKVLVTGGAGFIGTHLVSQLLDDGHEVTIFDNFTRNTLKYYPRVRRHRKLTVYEGCVRLLPSLIHSARQAEPDVVYHLAAIAGVSTYFVRPAQVMQINIEGTQNILEAVRVLDKRPLLVNFSSSEVYGASCFCSDESEPVRCGAVGEQRWVYAVSKIASEKLVAAYAWEFGLQAINVRPFNIYGPGQVGESAVSCFTRNAVNGDPLAVTDDGTSVRAYCHINDFLWGLTLAARPENAGEAYNIGNATEATTTLQLARVVQHIAAKDGTEIDIHHKPHPGQDVWVRVPSHKKMEKLGYLPKIRLADGLQETYEWWKTIKEGGSR